MKKINKMSDKKVLETLYNLLERAEVTPQFVQDSGGLITHSVVVVSCGDLFFASDPTPLPTPFIPVEKIEGTKH